MKSFLGSGCLFIDRLSSDGSAQGLMDVGNATKFEIKPDAEKKEQTSKRCDTYGQVLATVVQPKPATVSIAMDQWDKDTLAMALFGEALSVSVTGATVTDEAVTAHLDKWSDLAHRKVSSVIVTGSGGSPSYTEGDDYEVDADMGMIKALSAGSISDGAALEVDYTYASRSFDNISGATESNIKTRLVLKGKNQVNGKPCLVDVYEAQLSPAAGIDFLSDDFGVIELEGTLVTPTGKSKPFNVEYEE